LDITFIFRISGNAGWIFLLFSAFAEWMSLSFSAFAECWGLPWGQGVGRVVKGSRRPAVNEAWQIERLL